MIDRETLAGVVNTLLNKNYTIHIDDGREIQFFFARDQFYHLLGLHYIADIPIIANPRSRSEAVRRLLKDERLFKSLLKSQFFPVIRPRIEEFHRVVDMLIADSCEVIINFDKTKVPSTKINSELLLYKTDDHRTYFLLGLGRNKNGRYYPETYIAEDSKYYVTNQETSDCVITYAPHK